MDKDELRSKISSDLSDQFDRIASMYNAPFARFLGIEVDSITADEVRCHVDLRPELLNSMERGHGAAVYGLIDHTFAISANLFRDCTGLSSEIKYHRPAQGRITAVSRPINRSKSIKTYDVRAFNEQNKLIASSVCTAFVLEGRS